MSIDVDSLMPEIEAGDKPPDLPEAQLNTEAPADKEPPVRAEDGKFAAKDQKEAAKEPAKAEPKPETKPEPKTIPLAAHLEERNKFKAELDALRREMEAIKNPPKPPPAEPDYAQDPKGYTDHKLKSALDALEGTKKQVEQAQQTAQLSAQQTEQLQFTRQLEAAESAFVKEAPDYYDALNHVRQVRAQQLKLLAPDISDEHIARQIGQEELGLAMNLARAGRNPIATVYQMAQAYGYSRKEKVELPDIQGKKKLPPDQTLGTGAQTDSEPSDESSDPFEEAFGQVFGKRKAS